MQNKRNKKAIYFWILAFHGRKTGVGGKKAKKTTKTIEI